MRRLVVANCHCIACAGVAFGQAALVGPPEPIDPAKAGALSLEELMDIEVTGVAGVEQQVLRTPAAIDVITNEDVRRSGHRSLAEALRLSPGMFVGRFNAHRWSISPRGFNGFLANKTLVLMDGRRLYDPLQGGTFWDVQDTLLEDVDRIEIIRGPGATLWGANAANGVINIVTKSSKETQGLFVETGAGTEERGFGSFRYGGQFAENAWFSAWGKYANHGPLEAEGPRDSDDEWDLGSGRFRTDVEGDDGLRFTFELGAYSSFRHRERFTVPVPAALPMSESRLFDNRVRGAHALARLERFSAPDDGWSVLAYYDRTERDERDFEVARDSFEIDARRHFRLGDSHTLAVGLEYYYTADRVDPSEVIGIDPESSELQTVSGFVQDTITLRPDRWFAMLGAKLEHNEQTGFEIQPSARVWYTPDDRQTVWAAVSRSVRIPSRTETDAIVTLFFADPGALAGMPTGTIEPFDFLGEPGLEPEKIVSYELGYRNRLTDRLAVDLALFYTEYDDLVSLPRTLIGGRFNNHGSADTIGGEVALTWTIADNWRVRGSYSYVEVDVAGPVVEVDEDSTPHSQARLASFLDVTERLQLNAAAYYVGEVPAGDIDAYVRLDVGVTWRVNDNFDVSVWGQNLLDPSHPEVTALEVERAAYIVGTLRF